jgi:competence protein ComFA
METYLQKGGHVGFATPRKDVVIDLLPSDPAGLSLRPRPSPSMANIPPLLEGDIVVLTTHQLYRYDDYFDLLVLDEIDAFPFRDNEMLQTFFRHSVRGHYVLLSATPSRQDLAAIKKDNGEVVELFERYHHHPLPVPEYVSINPLTGYAKVLWALRQFRKAGKPVFIFTPTIASGKELYRFLHLFFTDGRFVSSEEEERKVDIARFKEQGFSYLVTTSILERGVTVKDLQVIVYEADHDLYTAASLVQISGRVGRKLGATGGQVLLMAQEENETIKEAIESIQAYNQKAGL